MSDNKTLLDDAIVALETCRESLPKTSAISDIPRLVAIARTHIETAELFLTKASDLLPG